MSANIDQDRTQDLPTVPEEMCTAPKTPVFPDNPQNMNSAGKGPDSRNKKQKKQSKGRFHKDTKALNIVMTILTIAINAVVFYAMFNLSRYASFSKKTFVLINVAVLLVLLIYNVLIIMLIRSKKIFIFVIDVIVAALLTGVGGYAVYALFRVDSNVNKITGSTDEEDVSASLVVYNGSSNSLITDTADLDGKTVGIAKDTKTAEIAKKKLSAEGINVTYAELPGYTDVFTNLVNGKIDCAVLPVTYQSDYADDSTLSQYLTECTSILDFSDTVTTTTSSGADKDITTEPFTVLVTGENQGLADTIILMTVNPISMKIVMTSIARDSFVPITCYNGTDSKINSAHAVSEDCMVKTVEELTGVDIDYTIEFNFASVIQVVDAVGGVDVDIPVSFDAQGWDVTTDSLYVIPLQAGNNVHLNGMEALGFARERMAFADGDFARQRHQQEIIEQVVSKIMATKNPQTFLDILDAAGDNIKTNFSVNQMTSFISYAMQKAKRYYNSDSVSGLFHFVTSRIYGYNANIWDSSLGMNLYIYRLYNGSISDNAEALKRNEDMTSSISTSVPVDWSAANTYEADPISQETYSEATITDTGEPTATPEATASATANSNSGNTSTDGTSGDSAGDTDAGGTDAGTTPEGGNTAESETTTEGVTTN
jgi:LCP family protein required for cell wall assembly